MTLAAHSDDVLDTWRPRHVPGFVSREVRDDNVSRYVVKVANSSNYLQFDPREAWIVSVMQGRMTAREIIAYFKREASLEISDTAMRAFLERLADNGLIYRPGEASHESRRKRLHEKVFSRTSSLLFFNMHLFSPDWLLDRAEPFLGFMFRRTTVLLVAFAALIGLGYVLGNLSDMSRQFQAGFGWQTMLVVYAAAVLITAVHEIGHGLACKHFGGQVNSTGLLVIMLTFPCLYTDVSDSWLMRKRERMLITCSGIYFEAAVWVCFILVYALSEPGGPLNAVAIGVILSSLVSMMLSLNPFMKFDGYYLASDYFGVPNLRKKAISQVRGLVQRAAGFTGLRYRRDRIEFRPYLCLFGLATVAVLILFVASIVSTAFYMGTTYLGTVGILPASLASAAVIWQVGGALIGGRGEA